MESGQLWFVISLQRLDGYIWIHFFTTHCGVNGSNFERNVHIHLKQCHSQLVLYLKIEFAKPMKDTASKHIIINPISAYTIMT